MWLQNFISYTVSFAWPFILPFISQQIIKSHKNQSLFHKTYTDIYNNNRDTFFFKFFFWTSFKIHAFFLFDVYFRKRNLNNISIFRGISINYKDILFASCFKEVKNFLFEVIRNECKKWLCNNLRWKFFC